MGGREWRGGGEWISVSWYFPLQYCHSTSLETNGRGKEGGRGKEEEWVWGRGEKGYTRVGEAMRLEITRTIILFLDKTFYTLFFVNGKSTLPPHY